MSSQHEQMKQMNITEKKQTNKHKIMSRCNFKSEFRINTTKYKKRPNNRKSNCLLTNQIRISDVGNKPNEKSYSF